MAHDLQRGDLIVVEWVDIVEDVAGDADEAHVAVYETPGYYVDERDVVISGRPVRVIVLARHREPYDDRGGRCGWITIPQALITRLERIRRPRPEAEA